MAKLKRIYSAPLVVTVAAWVGPACSSTPSGDDAPQSGGAGVGGKGSGGASSGGRHTGGASGGGPTGGRSQTGGAGGDGENLPDCSPEVLYFLNTSCDPGAACKVEMTCTSGTPETVVLVCADTGVGFGVSAEQDTTCSHPYESCVSGSATYDCFEDTWMFHGGGGNPPAPCPETRPEDGATCSFGFGFGADRDACGYPCEGSGWTVTGCVAQGGAGGETAVGPGVWESDGSCEAQGGDGGK